MNKELIILTGAAASIGFIHTLLGPDHYLPFIVMSQAGKWSRFKTFFITFFCGLGHVASSVFLGLIGVFFGIAISKLEGIESWRGDIAAWLLITFGLLYFIWGLRKVFRGQSHEHQHAHLHEDKHSHLHNHNHEHLHLHAKTDSPNLTPWILFTIFVFGPCEPLIPLLMYPAANLSFFSLFWIIAVFSIFTIGTMLLVVNAFNFGLSQISIKPMERFSHALAGAIILLSGLGIKFLGL